MKDAKVIPIFRIFDYSKTIEFYIDWLGFTIEWEHRFDDNAPIYMCVKKGDILFHLSEHHGDGTPGSRIFVNLPGGLKEYHAELISKKYKYNRPGLEEASWNAFCMTVNDPFGNTIIFNEDKK